MSRNRWHSLHQQFTLFFFPSICLLLFSSTALAQFDKVTDLLNGNENSQKVSQEVIIIANETAVVDQQGRKVAGMYRGDTLDVLGKSNGKYEVRSPNGWINAKDVLELDTALKSLTGRSRKRNDPNLIINRALVNNVLGESDRAIASLDKLLKKNPDNIAALLARGRVLLSSADSTFQEPPVEIVKAYQLEPENIHALIMMLESYNVAGKPEKILELLNNTTIQIADHPGLLIEKGFAQWMSDQYEEALKSLNAAIKKGTRLPVAWMHRGNVYVSLGQDDKAVVDLTKAIELDPYFEDAYYYRGDLYERNGELEKAIADYTNLIELTDFPAEAYIDRGDLYRQLRKFEKALNDFELALFIDLDDSSKARALFLQALTYDDTDKTEKALAGYAATLAIDPKLVGPNRERARLLSTLGKWKEAEAELRIAVKLAPQDGLAWRFLGDLLRITKQYQEAVTAYEAAIKLAPENSSSWNNQALTYEYLDNNTLAVKAYEQAIKLKPADIVYRINAATLYRRLGHFDIAVKHLSEAISLNKKASLKDRAELYFKRGDVYRFAGEHEKAIVDLDAALKIQKDFTLAYNSRGICYEAIGKFETAINNYNRAIELEPENFIFTVNRGDAFKKSGQGKKAYQDYTRAIELNAESALAFRQRGTLLLNNSEYEAAIRDLEQALKLNSNYLAAKIDLGDAHRYAGNYEKAIDLFSQVLIKDSQSTFILFARADCYRNLGRKSEAEAGYRAALNLDKKHAISWVGLGQLYESKDRYEEAIGFYNEVIKISPNYIAALYRKGFCQSMLRQDRESIEALSKVLKLSAGHSGARLFRANSYRELGDFEKAHQDYEIAIKNVPNDPYLFLGRARSWKIQQKYQLAIADYTQAIKIEIPKPIPFLFNERARLLASVTDPEVFNPKQAILDAQKACQLVENSNVQYLDTLAVAFAADGQFEEAVKTQKQAISLAIEKKYTEAEMEQGIARLNLYENNKPFVLAEQSSQAMPNTNNKKSPNKPKRRRGIRAGAGRLFEKP